VKILLSAFSCDPEQGSEPGVGWAWALQLAKSGNDVVVLTRESNRTTIESRLRIGEVTKLRFVYFGLGTMPKGLPRFGIYAYYFAWQWKAYLIATELIGTETFDCVHHITYGTYRTPCFLSLLPIPAIFGPIGGGESTPLCLAIGLSPIGFIQEVTRALVNRGNFLNPIAWLVWRNSALILATTEATRRMVPNRYKAKTKIVPAITTPEAEDVAQIRRGRLAGECRALFVGRLLEWKGVHLAIKALAVARKSSGGITLGIRGDGKCKAASKSLISREGVETNVEWIRPFQSRNEVLKIYDEHDVLVFPSFHDSGGTVVLEALSRGLPVICLDLGGPGTFVDGECGSAVGVEGKSELEIIRAIADQYLRFAGMSESEFEEVRRKAKARAARFTVDKVIDMAYSGFRELREPSGHPVALRT
jgi:glycosyltransferase involved in cell wall biosynthesis